MSSTAHILALPPGYVLESYRIERVLGEGGFGITYLAVEMESEKRVAIKEMLPGDIATRVAGSTVVPKGDHLRESFEWALDCFGKEAKALAKLSHPNIVPIHRLFRANGTAYMVMDFVEGMSLKHWLTSHQEPDEEELRGILLPLLDGLEHVHESGLLHRDIKPDNIFITAKGRPVLLDFGSARVDTGRTQTMTAVVSEGYAPFEQYQRKARQGPATDLYSLAAVMVRAITGETPPPSIDRIADENFFKPVSQTHAPRYSTGFLRAVDAAFAVKVDDRPQSVAAWREMLLGLPVKPGATSRVPSATPTTASASNTAKTSEAGSSRVPAGGNTYSKKKTPVLVAVPVLLIAGTALGWWYGLEQPRRAAAARQSQEAALVQQNADVEKHQRLAKEKADMEEKLRQAEAEKAQMAREKAAAEERARQMEAARLAKEKADADERLRQMAAAEQRQREEDAKPKVLKVPADYATINAAMSAARPNDTVLVSPGIYEECVSLKSGVELRGASRDSTIIRNRTEDRQLIDVSSCSSGTVSNLTIDQKLVESGDRRSCAVSITDSTITLDNCHITCLSGHGVAIDGTSDSIVANCRIENCGWNGILIYDNTGQPELRNNTCSNNTQAGISFWKNAHGTARGNACTDNHYCGISVTEQCAVTLQENICSGNQRWGIWFSDGSSGRVEDNTCNGNSYGGFGFRGRTTSPEIIGNRANDNGRQGILVETVCVPKRFVNNSASGNKMAQIDRAGTWND